MMRQPTPRAQLYAYWRAALAGKKPAITHDPECGFYKRRLVKGGPWVAVVIWLEQDTDEIGELIAPEVMHCEVNGRAFDPIDVWTYCGDKPITEKQYRFMTEDAAWAKRHAKDDPVANPMATIDLTAVPLPF